MDVMEACRETKVMKAVSLPTQEALRSYGALKYYKKGQHLFLDRTKVDKLYFLIQGTAALYKVNSRHEKKVIFIYGEGEMLNEVLLQDELSSINCELLSDSLILQFPMKKFLAVMEQDFILTKAVMDSMAIKIRRLYRQLKNTSNSVRLDKQIAAKLWKLSIDHGKYCEDGVQIDFDLSISYLADMVGSKRETVSRQVKVLTELGLIKFYKGRFTIKNSDQLLKYFKET